MELATVLDGIRKHREALVGRWQDPVALSESQLKLSVYNSYLADDLASLHKAATDKAYAVFTESTGKGEGVTKAEQMARGESTEERYLYENVSNIYRATDNLINSIKKQISTIENQIRREGEQ